MAVDLFDLVETLKREVSPPGEILFPAADDSTWLGYLTDAFWNARLAGMLEGFTLADSSVVPVTIGDDDISRDWLSLVVLFAAITIVTNELRRLNTSFRAKAGPVEFETAQSANLLRDVLAELQSRRAVVMKRLSDLGEVTDAYIDAVIGREWSIQWGDSWWIA